MPLGGYFDHNATTPLDERVLEAMLPFMKGSYGNPSSIHRMGRLARSAIDTAREQVAALVNAHPSQVIFTSGATEANNLAIKGVAWRHSGAHMLYSSIEHPSVQDCMTALHRLGWQCERIKVDSSGRTTMEELSAALRAETHCVSVMWANNETGVVNDIAALATELRNHGVLLHSDAVQAVGKIAVDFARSGAHMMSISGHKMYGPKGVGALLVERGLELEPLLHGGGQERGVRAGTENVAGLVGFGKAAELAAAELVERSSRMRSLRDHFEQQIRAVLPHCVIFAEQAERLPNTVFMAVPGIEGQTLIMALDRLGYAVSGGSACGSEHHEPSTTLKAMGVEAELARCAVRVSLGRAMEQSDVDGLVSAIVKQVNQLQGQAATAWA